MHEVFVIAANTNKTMKENKKQKSIDFMQSHRSCDICKVIKESFQCVTNAIVCNQCRLNKSRANKIIKDKSRSLEMEQLIQKSKQLSKKFAFK